MNTNLLFFIAFVMNLKILFPSRELLLRVQTVRAPLFFDAAEYGTQGRWTFYKSEMPARPLRCAHVKS
jgi:hypothetical protein